MMRNHQYSNLFSQNLNNIYILDLNTMEYDEILKWTTSALTILTQMSGSLHCNAPLISIRENKKYLTQP
jgi:hypothetical protein